MEDTIFMKIIRREIPANIVYEDEDTIAFLDATPVNPGHTLVVPKKFARNIFDADDTSLSAVARTVQKIARTLRETLHAEGVNIHVNNESVAGQMVFHFHMHVIPRFANDGLQLWHGKPYPAEEAVIMAEKIRAGIR